MNAMIAEIIDKGTMPCWECGGSVARDEQECPWCRKNRPIVSAKIKVRRYHEPLKLERR